jgi:glyoxylase-like metal-dependent hydrolase (beta-lactamase superfamily II)
VKYLPGIPELRRMNIFPLSEGAFTIDKSKLFVPFDTGHDDLQQRPTGSLLVEVQPFALVTSDDVLLIDTGLGFEKGGELQLFSNLRQAGIEPSEVTKVLMSHLHKDHAGGISRKNENTGNYELTFPAATYYVQRKEFEFAMEKGLPSYIPEELECLRDASNVQWLDGNGVIGGYIKYELTGAHSPFHQVFWIADAGEKIFFGGDDAPQLGQMRKKFIAKYDYDGRKCMELRQQWWQQGQTENWTFLFYHDVKEPVYKHA